MKVTKSIIGGTVTRDDVTRAVWDLVQGMNPKEDEIIEIAIEVRPRGFDPLSSMAVDLDFAGGSSIQAIRCVCGHEMDSVAELVAHFQAHGATRLEIKPENYNGRRRR
jgi:hypothetical protein